MQYLEEPSKVVYRAKDGTDEKVFDAPVSSTGQALEWLAAMGSHIPDKGERCFNTMVPTVLRFAGSPRGKRKETKDDRVPCILKSDKSSKEYPKNWARLIQKIYQVDPLTCPKCRGPMQIIRFIEDRQVIQTILKHLGLLAHQIKTLSQGPCPACRISHGSFLSTPHEQRSPLS
jgi:hypothetical protein